MFRMKTLAVAAVGAMLCLGQMALAQTQPAPACERLNHLTQTLNLTSDQQAKAQQIFTTERQQISQVLTPAQRAAFKAHRAFRTALKSLNLSADQQAKIKAIREDARTKAQAIMNNTSLSDEQKHTQFRALHQATQAQIMQVLTPAQQTQLQSAMKAAGGTGGRHGAKLSAAQRTQIRQIHQQALANFRAILTPAQQQQFDKLQASRYQCHMAPTAPTAPAAPAG